VKVACAMKASFSSGLQAVEMATLEWVDWFNNRRPFGPIGNILPAQAEAAYYEQLTGSTMGGVIQAK
jgi:transposase InsO family protein